MAEKYLWVVTGCCIGMLFVCCSSQQGVPDVIGGTDTRTDTDSTRTDTGSTRTDTDGTRTDTDVDKDSDTENDTDADASDGSLVPGNSDVGALDDPEVDTTRGSDDSETDTGTNRDSETEGMIGVWGYLTDINDNPVPDATVFLATSVMHAPATSDENGRYVVTVIHPGSYDVSAATSDLEGYVEEVEMAEGELTRLDITLNTRP